MLQKRLKEVRICDAFRMLRLAGIEPILIKGWASARHYPAGEFRHFNDIDIAVKSSDFAAANDLCRKPEFIPLNIDLHREFRHLDTVDWDDIFANSEVVVLNGERIRVPRAEDHLRIVCVHWLTDGGAYEERLLDIVYAIQNREPDFDWDRCLNTVSRTRRSWIICSIGLAHRYKGLYIDDLPFADDARQIPDWITKCIKREWKSKTRLQPVRIYLSRPLELSRQVIKRLPPNPIRATIEMEGSFDESSRVPFQIGSFLKMFSLTSGLADRFFLGRND